MNILITGASSGIGYQAALLLAGQGHTVFAIARNKDNLEKLREEAQKQNPDHRLHTVTADITREDFIARIEDAITAHISTLHVLINNAGLLINKPFDKLTLKDWNDVYNTNVFATVSLIRRMKLFMTPTIVGDHIEKTHILNISSMGGFQGSAKFKGLSAYSSSKAALANISECLAEEFKEDNIAVNCLCFGSVQTEMFTAAFPEFKAAATAKEMAAFVARFATEGQKLFNGKIIPVSNSTP